MTVPRKSRSSSGAVMGISSARSRPDPPADDRCADQPGQRDGPGCPGTRYPDAIWPDRWHRTYPMCAACWQTTRQVASQRRPGLVIWDTTSPARRLK